MDYNRIDAILEDYRARGYYPTQSAMFSMKRKRCMSAKSASEGQAIL